MTSDNELHPREHKRIAETLATLPADAATGLEIGFDDLCLTRLLRERMDLVSIDLPRTVRAHENLKLAFANVAQLPFRNGAFDVVICTEVLEHLPDDILTRAVAELRRVSRKYLLLSVPYRQRVWNEMHKCAHCGFVSNSMGHLRWLDERTLFGLFPGDQAKKIELVEKLRGYAPDWMYRLANRAGNAWSNLVFGNCPNCLGSPKTVAPNLLGFLVLRMIWRIEGRAAQRPAWIIALLELKR